MTTFAFGWTIVLIHLSTILQRAGQERNPDDISVHRHHKSSAVSTRAAAIQVHIIIHRDVSIEMAENIFPKCINGVHTPFCGLLAAQQRLQGSKVRLFQQFGNRHRGHGWHSDVSEDGLRHRGRGWFVLVQSLYDHLSHISTGISTDS